MHVASSRPYRVGHIVRLAKIGVYFGTPSLTSPVMPAAAAATPAGASGPGFIRRGGGVWQPARSGVSPPVRPGGGGGGWPGLTPPDGHSGGA